MENVLIEFADGSELGMDLRALESRIRLEMYSTDCPNGPKETRCGFGDVKERLLGEDNQLHEHRNPTEVSVAPEGH